MTGRDGVVGLGMARALDEAGCAVSLWGRFGRPAGSGGVAVCPVGAALDDSIRQALVVDRRSTVA